MFTEIEYLQELLNDKYVTNNGTKNALEKAIKLLEAECNAGLVAEEIVKGLEDIDINEINVEKICPACNNEDGCVDCESTGYVFDDAKYHIEQVKIVAKILKIN